MPVAAFQATNYRRELSLLPNTTRAYRMSQGTTIPVASRTWRKAVGLFLLSSLLLGCGAASYSQPSYPADSYYTTAEYQEGGALPQASGRSSARPAPIHVAQAPGSGSEVGWNAQEQLAQVPADSDQPGAAQGVSPTRPMLIYTAVFHLSVFQVEESQRQVIAVAEQMGGFLFRRDDRSVTIRVPAQRFQESIDRIEQIGDVLHRAVEVTDITQEYIDIDIRLRNALAMRDRLEALLARAETVADALQIERELQRLTAEIETMRGRLRFLDDRMAYSTITVSFEPRRPSSTPGLFRLPFSWIYELGLPSLLNLW
ncbi:MAG: DUF4349 domain-containing protein [Bradymonadales bacterium]|nr:DUF4349 domain-containing protein [Bradymonadales bacterium]